MGRLWPSDDDDDDNDDAHEQSPESGDGKEVGGKMSGFCEWGSGWPPGHIHCQFYYIFYYKLGTASRKSSCSFGFCPNYLDPPPSFGQNPKEKLLFWETVP